LELNISSNQIRIDQSFEDIFDFSALKSLQNLDLNLSFNDINPEFLGVMFKQMASAENITTFSINL
jgi:hypothetical protein